MNSLPSSFLTIPITHRALHDINDGRPENSREAILAAIDAGYGIEIDVQLSSDGQAIVFHDYDLSRLTQHSGLVRDFTADELSQMHLKGGKTGPATLSEVLNLINAQVPVLIEIKDQSQRLEKTDGVLEHAVCSDLSGYKGDVGLMSFNPHAVADCKLHSPEIARGLVTDPFTTTDWPDVEPTRLKQLIPIDDYAGLGCSFISHNQSDLSSIHVQKIKDAGAKILCWTVKTPDVEKRARIHADNITFEGYLA
jgi:glycerophosphoryl diester phosphodiesterase